MPKSPNGYEKQYFHINNNAIGWILFIISIRPKKYKSGIKLQNGLDIDTG